MKSRIPVIVLGALVLVAVIWRAASPPAPPPPGPRGSFPKWTSRVALGKMSSQAVNPAGHLWAGAWNEQTRDGKPRSAVWIIDLSGYEARVCEFKKPLFVANVTWADDSTIRALSLNAHDPASADKSDVIFVDALTAEPQRTLHLKEPVAEILAWPAGSDRFVGRALPESKAPRLALASAPTQPKVPDLTLTVESGDELYPHAAISDDGQLFVYSVIDRSAGGGRLYYLADDKGRARPVVALSDLPGRVEGLWVSQAGVLFVCVAHEDIKAVVYDLESDVLKVRNSGVGSANLKANWPQAPEKMMFTTYRGGYAFDLANGKTRRLFDFSKLGKRDEYWRESVRDGRLYPIKNGYVSVSMIGGAVDIRELTKDGTLRRNLLPR